MTHACLVGTIKGSQVDTCVMVPREYQHLQACNTTDSASTLKALAEALVES